MNKRRRIVVALGASAFTLPLCSLAQQQGKVWKVGFLGERNRPVSLDSEYYGGFTAGMRELGYVEGKNLVIEWRFTEGRLDLLPVLAAELVRAQVDAILSGSTPATAAAQKVATSIPIVMSTVGDPVGSGFIKSLAHPGGNITGLTIISNELGPKHLEMLRSMVPKLSRIAVLVNFGNPTQEPYLKQVQGAGQKTGVTILPFEARTPQEIDLAFVAMMRERVGGAIVSLDALFNGQRRQIAELADKYRLPLISGRREYVDVGFLMGYGPNVTDIYRRAATYMDKIFKGSKPADLPVEQPMKFELVINGKTAKALGLKIPQSLLVMADKVIE